MSALSAFTTQLVRFFEELVDTFPEEKDIRMALEAITQAKKINPRLILDLFHEHIYSGVHQAIADRDVDAIIQSGRVKVSTQVNEIMPAITLFDKHWKNLDDSNRDVIWKYLHVLCTLSAKARGA